MPEMVRPEELPRNRHFEIQALFAEEQRRVNRWFEAEATEALSAPASTVESAHLRTEGLIGKFELLFCTRLDVKPQLLIHARNGTLKGHAPGRLTIMGYNLLRLIAFMAEISVAIAFMAMGQATAVFLLVSIMLALGGLALGHGVGGLLVRSWFRSLPEAFSPPQPTSAAREYLETAGGVVTVAGISFLRAQGEEGSAMLAVVGVPLLLALLITLFESFYVLATTKYAFLRRQMAEAQRWYAIENHRAGLDHYRRYYKDKVRELNLHMQRALRPAG
jgi:hypothetical protein